MRSRDKRCQRPNAPRCTLTGLNLLHFRVRHIPLVLTVDAGISKARLGELEVRKIENDQGRLPSWAAVARPAFVTMIAFAAMRPDVSAHAQRGLFGLYPYYDAPRYQVLPPEEVAPVVRKKRAARYPNIPDAPPKGTGEAGRPDDDRGVDRTPARQGLRQQRSVRGIVDLSGTTGHTTPTGIFSIIQKNKHHRSNLYSNAPMPYMQRITWSGVALHEGHLPRLSRVAWLHPAAA